MLKYRRLLASLLSCLLIVCLLNVSQTFAQETEDSRLFLSGFNAYQKSNYKSAIQVLNDLLQKHPDTPLRDMALFWLARSNFKAGNREDAARIMSRFNREFPDNPLKQTVEEELQQLAANYKPLDTASTTVASKPDDTVVRQSAAEKRRADEEAENRRIAAAKAEEQRKAAELARSRKLAAEKAAREQSERVALAKAEQERQRLTEQQQAMMRKAEEERIAALKAEEERRVLEEIASEQMAAAKKAEEEKALQAKAEAERMAQAKAEAEKLAAAKKTEEELAAQKKAEADRLLAAQKEEERLARSRAERIAKAEAEAEKRVAEKAAEEKAAAQKAAQKAAEEKIATQKAAEERVAAQKAAEKQASAQKAAAQQQMAVAEQQAMREKAIAEYKSILERFPNSPAAQTAVKRLQGLGIAVAAPPVATVAAPVQTTPNTQILTLEVAQYAAFEFTHAAPGSSLVVARPTSIPFEIVNRGNGRDSFYLASAFPAEFGARFYAQGAPDQSINQTPMLAPGEHFKGLFTITVPAATIDGLRINHPIKAASQFMQDVTQSREVAVAASAPLMRAVVKVDKQQLDPGEKATYRVTVMNIGSATAENVTLRINFPPQLEPLSPLPGGFRQEMNAALLLDGIGLKSGESRELTVPFTVRENALAREELMVRADLVNEKLQTRSAFLSNVAFVQPRSSVEIRLTDSRITAIPGQTLLVPATVVNRGNLRESFSVVASAPNAGAVTIYHDLNRDGSRQPNEPVVKSIGPLGPREEAALLLEVTTPATAQDGTESGLSVSIAPESGQAKPVEASSRLIFSRPVVQLAMKGKGGRLVPGELLTVDLTITNQGSNLARKVVVNSTWPEQIELVATEPSTASTPTGLSWSFSELGAGEKRVVKASFRVKPTSTVGTGLSLKSELTYQDQQGNRY